jgi:hypothetical protein
MTFSIIFSLFWSTLNANIPNSGFSFPQKRWTFPIYSKLLHVGSNGSTRKVETFTNFFRAYSVEDVQSNKFIFCYFHRFMIAQNTCTATNTWKRVSLSTF